MHIISTSNVQIPSVQHTVDILTRHTAQFGVPLDYDRMLEYHAYYTIKGTKLKKRLVQYMGPKRYSLSFTKDDFAGFLASQGVSEGLLLTAKGKPSMSEDSLQAAIATGMYSEEICKVMELYGQANKCFKTIDSFNNIFNANVVAEGESWDNHRMLIVHPTWVPQNTGRIGAQNPNTIHDIFTVPKGYRYIEVDSGQIEPRMNQSLLLRDPQMRACTMLYNDAYFGYIHYCLYLTPEQRTSGTVDLTPIEITDEMKEMRKRFKTFGNATMYGSTENRNNDPYKAAFIQYIGNHPNRLALQRDIEHRIDRGQVVFKTAFGTEINIMDGPSAKEDANYSEKEQYRRKVKRAINNPIQGAAADLMRYSADAVDKLLQEKAPNSHILQYVHDAGKFAIHEDEYDLIINDIKEVTAYQVDDWIPIYSGVDEGVHNNSGVKRFIA